jgi:hypothetical protein
LRRCRVLPHRLPPKTARWAALQLARRTLVAVEDAVPSRRRDCAPGSGGGGGCTPASTQQGGQRRTDAGEPVGGRCVAAAATDRFRPCWPRMKHTPWLQSAPLHPLAHAQLWLPPLAVHVAPFLQGLLSHPVAWLQSAPLHPLAHAQLWLPPLAVHVAPFLQGLLPAVKSHPVLSLQSTPFHPPAQKQAGTPSTSLQKPWEPHSTSPAAVHECGCFRSAITPTSAPSAPAASRMPMATSSCHLRQQP